jgi:hypothetical protein
LTPIMAQNAREQGLAKVVNAESTEGLADLLQSLVNQFGDHHGAWDNSMQVFDVFENRKYADLSESHSLDENGKISKSLMHCNVGGSQCDSIESFNKGIAYYMDQ